MTTVYSEKANTIAVRKYKAKPGQKEIIKSRRNVEQEYRLAKLNYHTIDGWIKRSLCSIRSRAKRRNLDFNLTKEDIVIPEYCPILGFKLEIGNIKGFSSHSSPSIDRIDNNKGYIKGNVCVISNRANNLKNNGELKEFEALVIYLKRGK